MGSRAHLAACAALSLAAAGCLHADERAAQTPEMIVPPIVRVDRTVPASLFGSAILKSAGGTSCFEMSPSGESRPCSPEAEEEFDRATTDGLPRRGATARIVAELRLRRPKGSSRQAQFVVFPTRRSGVCFGVVYVPEAEELTCQASTRCPRICLSWYSEGDFLLLAGTVSAAADGLRLRDDRGASRLYALNGPLLPRVRERRVFMVDLGRGTPPARLELLAGDRVLESVGWNEMLATNR